MNLETSVHPREGSRYAKVLQALSDGKVHTTVDLRETAGLTKGGLSSALHGLRWKYGYVITSNDVGTHIEYELEGRLLPGQPNPYPQPGEKLEVVAITIEVDRTKIALRGDNQREYTVFLT